tara:strand:- start:226 stop:756 length:531 start_codon:yes stop_codon:yes gene_type:complete
MGIKKLNILSVDCDWVRSLKHQEELLSFVLPFLFNCDEIYLSYYHHEIYPLFTHNYDEYNLINIDQHHDYLYNDSQLKILDPGSWLYHLSLVFKKKINYTWISNYDSIHLEQPYDGMVRNNLKSYIFDHSISFITEKKFDKIFICCSPCHNDTTKEALVAYKIIERIVNDNKKPKP